MVAFTEEPRAVRNPNEQAPLVALVHFRTDVPASTRIEVDDGRKRRVVVYDDTHDPTRGLAVIGLHADTEHRIAVTASSGDGATASAALRHRTPPLPAGTARMPRFTVVTAEPGEMEPGYGEPVPAWRRGFRRRLTTVPARAFECCNRTCGAAPTRALDNRALATR